MRKCISKIAEVEFDTAIKNKKINDLCYFIYRRIAQFKWHFAVNKVKPQAKEMAQAHERITKNHTL